MVDLSRREFGGFSAVSALAALVVPPREATAMEPPARSYAGPTNLQGANAAPYGLGIVNGYGRDALNWMREPFVRTPVVFQVSSLGTTGPNTLAAALQQQQKDPETPMIIVFGVGGDINLPKGITIGSNTWLVGHTAPSPGITLTGGPGNPTVTIQGSNVALQNIRILGGSSCLQVGTEGGEAVLSKVLVDYCTLANPVPKTPVVRICQGVSEVSLHRTLIGGAALTGPTAQVGYAARYQSHTGISFSGTDLSVVNCSIINCPTAVAVTAPTQSGSPDDIKPNIIKLEVVDTCVLNCGHHANDMIAVRGPDKTLINIHLDSTFFRRVLPHSRAFPEINAEL